MSNRPEYSYIGRVPGCHCIIAAMVDDPDDKNNVAKEIASWIKGGLEVERVTHDFVRNNFAVDGCPHRRENKKLTTTQPELF